MLLEARNGQDKEAKWTTFVEAAFKAADLPDVPENQLETGTYTNRQIADKFKENPLKLVSLLMGLSGGDDASRRSILSFAADLAGEENPEKT